MLLRLSKFLSSARGKAIPKAMTTSKPVLNESVFYKNIINFVNIRRVLLKINDKDCMSNVLKNI